MPVRKMHQKLDLSECGPLQELHIPEDFRQLQLQRIPNRHQLQNWYHINQDGTVTRRDASMVWSIAKGTRTVGDDIMKLADVNGDGQVDALDSAIIYGYVSGKIKEFPGKLTE